MGSQQSLTAQTMKRLSRRQNSSVMTPIQIWELGRVVGRVYPADD
jgi:hypothetical protein